MFIFTNTSGYIPASEDSEGSLSPQSPHDAPTVSHNGDDRRQQAARKAYTGSVAYHLTQQKSKNSIRQYGFLKEKKCAGATASVAEYCSVDEYLFKNAREHHYLMKDKTWKDTFKYSEDSALVRAFKDDVHFEDDPDFEDDAIMRTAQDIPADNILGSKRASPSLGESRTMQKIMARSGINISAEEAGKLLREVQSDSEDDF